jgi:hypothetical protein
MNDMEISNRDYRDYDNRYYDEAQHGYRSYRDYRDYRDNYRDDYRNYRDNYRTREYDRRGGKVNYRGDHYEELEMTVEDMREQYRKLEDISEMVTNPQEKNVIMRVAQAEKQNYQQLKQIMEK